MNGTIRPMGGGRDGSRYGKWQRRPVSQRVRVRRVAGSKSRVSEMKEGSAARDRKCVRKTGAIRKQPLEFLLVFNFYFILFMYTQRGSFITQASGEMTSRVRMVQFYK